ncbi:MAG TPA: peptidase S10 [Phycisphaerae bacterium]|nr:peptidase S10 [Phycisphaerae bacterium]
MCDRQSIKCLILVLLGSLTLAAMGRPATAGKNDSTPESQPASSESKKPDKPAEAKPLEGTVDKAAVTHHVLSLPDGPLHYRAIAANMPMRDEAGKLKATVFFVAYEKETPADYETGTKDSAPSTAAATQPACREPSGRPITFVFNGGPGAAAVWLHLGTAGPVRITLTEEGHPLPPPYRLDDNSHTWLQDTDLVFIDPVGTGFSRPAEGEKTDQFYGVNEDIAWVADFIRLYTTQYQRWLSPRFLAGESYGTTRAAGLSEYLLDRYGLALNGIILISSVLEFQTLQPRDGNDLPYPLFLPTYAAVAWYHKKLPPDLQEDLDNTLREVGQWATENYAPALANTFALSDPQRREIVERLARYTGLPEDLISRNNLRIPPWVFQKQLLLSDQIIVGRFDGRITGHDPEPASSWTTYDPSLSQYFAAYSSTFNDYVRRTLKYESILPYEVLSDRVRPWRMGTPGEGFLSVADDLRSAMVKNPHMKILFASGHYDLATPFFATDYTINRLDVGPQGRRNITHTCYPGGHMMYHHQPSLARLKADVTAFILSAIAPGQPPAGNSGH